MIAHFCPVSPAISITIGKVLLNQAKNYLYTMATKPDAPSLLKIRFAFTIKIPLAF